MQFLITGGAGFIGSNFIHYLMENHPEDILINFDALTYAGNLANLDDISENEHYKFIRGDICSQKDVSTIFDTSDIDIVIHFAAESHVDRSINDASLFLKTNVMGTFVLLDEALKHGCTRFIHISTDEVYGSINEGSFKEVDSLNPSSPYSSSKASSDLIALSYFKTFQLPVIVTRCTNNFGPYQYPEKLIPLFTTNLLDGKRVPVYGTGKNVRDWLYVLDHCRAIDFLLDNGKEGEIYNIAGGEEKSNLEITYKILEFLDISDDMIDFVTDRPGHDFRYSLDYNKLMKIGWKPEYDFETALELTVKWYVENERWWRPLKRKI